MAARPTWVLGLAGSHNGAAALYRDDVLVCAVQEERLSRKKRDVLHPGRASLAVDAVLADQGLAAADLDLVVVAPLTAPDSEAQDVRRHTTLGARPHLVVTHHLAHALSAFACSGFEDATALVVDGLGSAVGDLSQAERAAIVGDAHGDLREAVSIYDCDAAGARVRDKHVARAGAREGGMTGALGPFASLGVMYQQVARLTFGSWDAAGKVMGLAPHGRARWSPDAFFAVGRDGRLEFRDTIDDFDIDADVGDTSGAGPAIGEHLVPPPRRYPEDAALHADLAASVQAALEVALVHHARRAAGRSRRLVCAGGVFLNSVANERVLRSGLFDEVFVVPFAEDSGTAVGAAFAGVLALRGPTASRLLEADALGPLPHDHAAAIGRARAAGASVGDGSWSAVAARIAAGQAVGLFHGRSELGPRALGQRSILYDPRRPGGQRELNARKGREPFRPFAPAILREHAAAWLDLGAFPDSPFMLRVAPVHPERRASIPAVTHVDGSARPETVTRGPLAEIVRAFHALTGVPLVLDTSFNRAGEPIVERACDAVDTFLAMPLDALWLDGTLLVHP